MKHPLWTHLPTAGLFGLFLVALWRAQPLPYEYAVHFNFTGEADRWASPWEVLWITIGFSVFFLLLSIGVDEAWARQETRKTFNVMSLFDEFCCAPMLALGLYYLQMLTRHDSRFHFPLLFTLFLTAATVLAGVVVELLRPANLLPTSSASPGDANLQTEEIAAQVVTGPYWSYNETQNAAWMNVMMIGILVLMLVTAVISWRHAPVMATIQLIVMLLLGGFLSGGMRVTVTLEQIQVRFGLLSIPLLRLPIAEITQIEVYHFAPLRDFGGYGIRFNREMKAYFFRGDTGVKIRTSTGKQYLIGSDRAERLVAVLHAAGVPPTPAQPTIGV